VGVAEVVEADWAQAMVWVRGVVAKDELGHEGAITGPGAMARCEDEARQLVTESKEPVE